jgi:hypothetical protein
LEKRKLAGTMTITRGTEKLVAIPVKEIAKLQAALKKADLKLGSRKTCCDFCCDWCDFTVNW